MSPDYEKYLPEAFAKAKQGICDGSCDLHYGRVGVYKVTHIKSGHEWGYFAYCANARDEDVSRGMNLKLMEE